MKNLYNVRLSYNGDGGFIFTLKDYGELEIFKGRDIFVQGMSVEGVESLRPLRQLLLDFKINGKKEGCFRVIELEKESKLKEDAVLQMANIKRDEPKSVEELKSEMIKEEGPIVIEEDKKEKEVKVENKTTSKKTTNKKSTNKKTTNKKSTNKK